jgi:hypothetical protein
MVIVLSTQCSILNFDCRIKIKDLFDKCVHSEIFRKKNSTRTVRFQFPMLAYEVHREEMNYEIKK